MFIITVKGNRRYKVRMRGRYQKTIRSEAKLLRVIQKSIDAQYTGRVKARFQELLDERDILRIAHEWGMLNWKCRVDENGKEIR